jgi:hypothetical protein
MTIGIDYNWYAGWNGCAADASNICIRLRSCRADANRVGLARYTNVANIDIVAAGGETPTGVIAYAMLELPMVLFTSALKPMAVL